MEDKKKVYVETSVISNLTARPSHNVTDAALQIQTINWWALAPQRFVLCGSQLLIDEISKGDSLATKRRLEAAQELQMLPISEACYDLAVKLLESAAVPQTSFDDAVHIATAAINGMDFLVTWNCKHIANAVTLPKIVRTIERAGHHCPIICTPLALQEGE